MGEGTEGSSRRFPVVAVCLLAGLAAGAAAFAMGEWVHGAFEPAGMTRRFQGVISDLPTPRARDRAMTRESASAFAAMGAALGFFLGLASGSIRGGIRRGAWVGAIGLTAGGLVGGLLSTGILPGALRLRDRLDVDPILIGSATQFLIWGPIAATAGAVFGLGARGLRSAPRFALIALGGAAIATLGYAAAGAAFFPLAETDRPVATARGARLLCHLLVALGTAAAVGLAGAARERRPETPETTTPAASA